MCKIDLLIANCKNGNKPLSKKYCSTIKKSVIELFTEVYTRYMPIKISALIYDAPLFLFYITSIENITVRQKYIRCIRTLLAGNKLPTDMYNMELIVSLSKRIWIHDEKLNVKLCAKVFELRDMISELQKDNEKDPLIQKLKEENEELKSLCQDTEDINRTLIEDNEELKGKMSKDSEIYSLIQTLKKEKKELKSLCQETEHINRTLIKENALYEKATKYTNRTLQREKKENKELLALYEETEHINRTLIEENEELKSTKIYPLIQTLKKENALYEKATKYTNRTLQREKRENKELHALYEETKYANRTLKRENNQLQVLCDETEYINRTLIEDKEADLLTIKKHRESDAKKNTFIRQQSLENKQSSELCRELRRQNRDMVTDNQLCKKIKLDVIDLEIEKETLIQELEKAKERICKDKLKDILIAELKESKERMYTNIEKHAEEYIQKAAKKTAKKDAVKDALLKIAENKIDKLEKTMRKHKAMYIEIRGENDAMTDKNATLTKELAIFNKAMETFLYIANTRDNKD